MKRFLTAALAALLLLTLPACGLLEKEENPPSQEPVSDPQPQEPEQVQQPEPRPGWTKGKNSKPPWEG